MAQRYCFISDENIFFKEELIDFKYYNGFALSQKRKCIKSLHQSIEKKFSNKKILEVSTKSETPIGKALSAFNLRYQNIPLENIFQSSKVFENGGPYKDILELSPKEAKRDERLKKSGDLICFYYNDEKWLLNPKTAFYDWIYINALYEIYLKNNFYKEVLNYDVFTDIEFNHKKSINCQARSVAIFVTLIKNGLIKEYLSNKSRFLEIYDLNENNIKGDQLDFFNEMK